VVKHKECIHSGHFMVSDFEADDNIGDEADLDVIEPLSRDQTRCSGAEQKYWRECSDKKIDDSLVKLSGCMSSVYKQKLTSPKWNRFLGLKLRWKDKIRLNNVIWRCWHMQFIAHKRKLPLAFANPLEAAIPAKEEGGGTLMMGKYWKRKMDGILAEYKKWRIFYKDKNSNSKLKTTQSSPLGGGADDIDLENMITNADFFVDAIFNDLESNLFSSTEDWTTMDNSDFIQSGLINIKQSEESPDFTSFSSYNCTEQGSPQVTDYQILESCDPLTVSLYQEHHSSPSYQLQARGRDKTTSQLANILQGGQYERPPPPPLPPPPPQTVLQAGSAPAPQTVLHVSEHIENTIVKKKSVIVSLSSVTSDLLSLNTTEPSTSTLTPGARPPPRKKIKLDKRSSSSSSSRRKSSEKQPAGESTNASFSKLNILVPSLSDSSLKISKAGQLMKTSEHIQQLQEDNDQLSREIEMLRSSSQTLLGDISGFQNKLSFNSSSQAPFSQQSKEEGTSLYNLYSEHIVSSTQQNWKYWIFSRLMRPLLESFDRSVSTQSRDDLSRTSSSWLDQHVNLVQLRPLVTETLKNFSVESSILTEPQKIPLEALQKAATSKNSFQ